MTGAPSHPSCPSSTLQPSSTQATNSVPQGCIRRPLMGTTPCIWSTSSPCPCQLTQRCLGCTAMLTSARISRRRISCSHPAWQCKVGILSSLPDMPSGETSIVAQARASDLYNSAMFCFLYMYQLNLGASQAVCMLYTLSCTAARQWMFAEDSA